jgi:hypothetical protein
VDFIWSKESKLPAVRSIAWLDLSLECDRQACNLNSAWLRPPLF